jgi:hypothetical protein
LTSPEFSDNVIEGFSQGGEKTVGYNRFSGGRTAAAEPERSPQGKR